MYLRTILKANRKAWATATLADSSPVQLYLASLSPRSDGQACFLINISYKTNMGHSAAQGQGCRAAGSSVLSFHFQMPQHFFSLQQIEPHVPLGLWQRCHQPRPSETSWLLLTGGSGGRWFPESSSKRCWDSRRPILPSHQQETSWPSLKRNCHLFSKYRPILAISFSMY